MVRAAAKFLRWIGDGALLVVFAVVIAVFMALYLAVKSFDDE